MSRITPALPEALLSSLERGVPALLITVGEDGWANSIFTWSVALDAMRVRFGVDDGSSAQRDLTRSERASLQFMAPGNATYLVKGRARLVRSRVVAAAPAAVMLYEMQVSSVKDQSWPGVEIEPLAYEWPADQRAALLRMEQAVYAEMRT